MTPKEKATELVNKFYFKLSNNGSLSMGLNSCDARHKESIQCALIAVDEILKDNNKFIQTNLQYSYWQDVKTQIDTYE
jgi:hypothetical protein